MLEFNIQKENCTGCTACASVCPKQCIKMIPDAEGFLYPEITNGCISCGLCRKVCPMVNPRLSSVSKKKVYWALSKSYKTWIDSSSGGAFSEICRIWNDGNAVIFGAAWDEMNVHHIGVNGYENVAPLRKSKYIASELGDTYKKIQGLLAEGIYVVFSGTPCQVAGLNSFLQRKYDNLLTIDLICHGVGSPLVFNTCIQILEKQFGKKVTAYQFRAKKTKYIADYLSKVSFEKEESSKYLFVDRYIQLFLQQLCLRPSCGKNCIFRDERRPGDITLADFRGSEKIFPDLLGIQKNYSSLVANTDKGLNVISDLNKYMQIREYQIDQLLEFNPLFSKHTWFSNSRDDFFKQYIENPHQAVLSFTKEKREFKLSWKRKLFNALPVQIKGAILRILYKKVK